MRGSFLSLSMATYICTKPNKLQQIFEIKQHQCILDAVNYWKLVIGFTVFIELNSSQSRIRKMRKKKKQKLIRRARKNVYKLQRR